MNTEKWIDEITNLKGSGEKIKYLKKILGGVITIWALKLLDQNCYFLVKYSFSVMLANISQHHFFKYIVKFKLSLTSIILTLGCVSSTFLLNGW